MYHVLIKTKCSS